MNRAQIHVVPELDGTVAVQAAYTTHGFRAHFHDTYLIGVTESGTEVFDARGGRHLSTELSLRFYNPGEVHTGSPPPGGHWAYRCLYPSADLLGEIARDLCAGRVDEIWFPHLVVADGRLAAALLDALGGLSDPSGGDPAADVSVVLGDILASHAGGAPGPPRVLRDSQTIRRAQDFIVDRVADSFSLRDLSVAVGLSRFHLARAFKVQVGLSPFAFHAQMRVERAKALLRQGRDTRGVTAACGFVDCSHLSRVFRALVGVPPRAYRNAFTGATRTRR